MNEYPFSSGLSGTLFSSSLFPRGSLHNLFWYQRSTVIDQITWLNSRNGATSVYRYMNLGHTSVIINKNKQLFCTLQLINWSIKIIYHWISITVTSYCVFFLNFSVTLLILVAVGALLCVLLIICLVMMCRPHSQVRIPPGAGVGFRRYRNIRGINLAPDKRAIVSMDTSSEESIENTPPPYIRQVCFPYQCLHSCTFSLVWSERQTTTNKV